MKYLWALCLLKLETVPLKMKDPPLGELRCIMNLNAKGRSHNYINQIISGRAYTHEETKKLVDTGDYRLKAVILLLASSGIRIDAMENLLVRHLERRNNNEVYKVTLYENTKEEYYSFTTPEAKKAIDEYLDYRKRCGENIIPTSPLFRTDFRMNDIQKIRKEAKAVSLETIKSIIHSRLVKLGLIAIPFEDKTRRDPARRNSVPLAHGFRKFWMNQAVKSKLNPELREMLLGHSIGLASAYYKPTEDEMLDEYMKATDNLTINEENRLRRKVEKLEVEKNSFESLAAEIEMLKRKIIKIN